MLQAAKADADFIDENFHPFVRDNIRSEVNCDPRFCPKEFRDAILDMIVYHFHLHPMIPNDQNQYFTADEIWFISVREMYQFCVQKDLRNVCGQIGIKNRLGDYGPDRQVQIKWAYTKQPC